MKGKVWKNCLLVVTPVKLVPECLNPGTGVQPILKGFKILDSGFRRNDGKMAQVDFFTDSGGGWGNFIDGLINKDFSPNFRISYE